MGIFRYLVGKPAELVVSLGSRIGVGGVLVGNGRKYVDKLEDGLTAVPDIVDYFPNLFTDLDRITRTDHGLERVINNFGNKSGILDSLKRFKFKEAAQAAESAYDGAKEIVKVATELDYNKIWESLNNFADNITDRPLETGLAAGTLYVGGWVGARLIRFWRTRGQGTILDQAERELGKKTFKKYFQRKRIKDSTEEPKDPEKWQW